MVSISRAWRPALLGLGLTGTLLLGVASPVRAQLGAPNSTVQTRPESEDPNSPTNLFNNRGGSGGLMNLLNQLQLMNGRTGAEFNEDVNNNLQSAAEEFRNKQRLQLDQSPGVESEPFLVPAP